MFPREYNGQFADNDVYIDCQKGTKIFHYGNRILEAYIPSIGRGHNIIKAIQEDLGNDIIFNIEETAEEILFRFNSKNMSDLEKYLKPKTSAADRSPFSSKNLEKTKYIIPDEDLEPYKDIIEKIGQNRIIELTHMTNSFLKSLTTKKRTWDDIKADMALKGLSGKNYVHAIGKWDEYIKYLNNSIGGL